VSSSVIFFNVGHSSPYFVRVSQTLYYVLQYPSSHTFVSPEDEIARTFGVWRLGKARTGTEHALVINDGFAILAKLIVKLGIV